MSQFTVAAAETLEGPEWLRRRRAAAAERFGASALPTTDEEVWRYSRIADLDLDRYQPNGLRSPRVESAGDHGAVREADEAALGEVTEAPIDAFTTLNDAFMVEPRVVRVPPGVTLTEPIVLRHVAGDEGVATFPRLVVEVGEGASATVVERYHGGPDAGADVLTVPLTELRIARGGRLNHVIVQDLGLGAWQIGTLVAEVGQEAHLASTVAGFGGDYARQRTDCRLVGRGASCELNAVYFGEADQTLDFRTFQDHVAPDTTSNLLFKGAVAGHSHSVYTGLIRVGKGARGSNALQTNRNIKLSEGAWAESVPNLEIENNDVRCSHASAVGPIDEEQRFYLESRGVPRAVAERLVVTGFFDEVLEQLPAGGLAADLRGLIAGKLDRSDR